MGGRGGIGPPSFLLLPPPMVKLIVTNTNNVSETSHQVTIRRFVRNTLILQTVSYAINAIMQKSALSELAGFTLKPRYVTTYIYIQSMFNFVMYVNVNYTYCYLTSYRSSAH